MSTQFKPLEIPPGVVALATKKQRSSNWSEANLVRWSEGQLSPVGPQMQYGYTFASRCRKIHSWYGVDGTHYIAYLCETNLYVDAGGLLFDITPAGGLAAPAPATVGGYGVGSYGAGAYGGLKTVSPIIALERLPNVYSLANFGGVLLAMTSFDGRLLQWDPGQGALGATGNLAATAAFTTSSPNITMVANPGWVTAGMSVYDTTNSQYVGTVLTYTGTALVLTANALHASAGAADVLSFGNIARPVVANSGRGPVPTGRCFVVTPERFVLVFGAFDATNGGGFRRFAWCDQENFQAWDYSSVTSQAGFLDIEPSSPIVTAISTRTGTLFWSGKKPYVSQFIGMPYVFNYVELAEATTPWSPQSMVMTSAMVLWFSEQGLFSYDGTSILPVACKIRPWIDDDIDDLNVREQACAVHVENFNEFWWFYPQNGQAYNTRAVIYNYKEGWWSMARMARSAGITSAYNAHTIMANGALAYQHEVPAGAYSPDADLPWAETFDLNLVSGARLTTIKQMIPDIDGAAGNVLYSLFYRNARVQLTVDANGVAFDQEIQTDKKQVRSDGYVDFRTTGRDLRLRIDLATSATEVLPVTIGQHLIDSVQRGDR